MVTLAVSQDPLVKPALSSAAEEIITDVRGTPGLVKSACGDFGRFMPQGEGDTEITPPLSENAFAQETFPPVEAYCPEQTLAPTEIPMTVPAAKDVLTLKDWVDQGHIENAESLVSEEVSENVLGLAMAIQEEVNQQPEALPAKMPQDFAGTQDDFPDLKAIAHPKEQQSPGTAPKEEKTGKPPLAEKASSEGVELRTASLVKKPATPAAPTPQRLTARENMVSTPNGSLKEITKALEGSEMDLEGESTFDEEPSLMEMQKKESKGDGAKTVAAGKSFGDAIASASGKAEGTISAESSPLMNAQSTDGKVVEAAFNRAQETAAHSGAKSSPQAQSSQHTLPSQASPQEQIAFSIKNNAGKGKSEITLQLRPDRLGRVNVKIDVNQEGKTYVVVATERVETQTILQKDASQLTALLKESGLSLEEGDVSYNLFKDQAQQDKESQENNLSEDAQHAPAENTPGAKVTGPMIPLNMGEVRVPQHGGTWAALA